MARRKFTPKWQMHESSQRGLCRAAFVLLGVIPLMAVLALSAAEFIPAYQVRRAASWSAWLSNRLGVNVQIAAVELLAPDRFVLHGLKITHPESRAGLGRIRSVSVNRNAVGWNIELNGPELETRQLATTWQMIHDWFVCRPDSAGPPLHIECDELRVCEVGDELSLDQIAVDIYTQSERTVVGAQFRMPTAAPESKPSMLRIVRQHGDRHLSTVMELDSGLNALPLSMISPVLPIVRELGPNAVFQGRVAVHQRNKAWQLNVTQSWFAGVDFGQLTSRIDSRITGDGWLWCENLKVTDRGLLNVSGGVMVKHGRIDESLLNASQQLLGVHLPRQVQMADVRLHSFEQLRAMFEISPGVFKLAGDVEQPLERSGARRMEPGTLIADAAGELAIRSSYEPIPIENLVAALGFGQTVSAAAVNDSGDFEKTWFAQRAAWWLPLEADEPLSQADASQGSEEATLR